MASTTDSPLIPVALVSAAIFCGRDSREYAGMRRFAASVKARTAAVCSGAPSPNFMAK